MTRRDPVRVALAGVLSDLRHVGLTPDAALYDLELREWVVGSGSAPVGFSAPGFVVRVQRNEHLIADADNGQPDPADIVAFIQDWAMDELGSGWPEQVDEGGEFIGILLPRTINGIVFWLGKNGHVARVGSLLAPRGM